MSNVWYDFTFNQFTFTGFDKDEDEKYTNYKGYLVSRIDSWVSEYEYNTELVANTNLFPEMPYYEKQLGMITEAYEELLDKLNPDFEFSLCVNYNNYGTILLQWFVDEKNLDELIKLHESIISGGWTKSEKFETLLTLYSDLENYDDVDYYVEAHNVLGYSYDEDFVRDLKLDLVMSE